MPNPFPNPKINSSTVDVWGWMIKFIQHFMMGVPTYPSHISYCIQLLTIPQLKVIHMIKVVSAVKLVPLRKIWYNSQLDENSYYLCLRHNII